LQEIEGALMEHHLRSGLLHTHALIALFCFQLLPLFVPRVCLQDIEEALMKRDAKRQKLGEGKNVPELVARVNESNAAALRRRTKMMLPAPQVGMHAMGDLLWGRCSADCPATGLEQREDITWAANWHGICVCSWVQ
jgi:hypothetical protein